MSRHRRSATRSRRPASSPARREEQSLPLRHLRHLQGRAPEQDQGLGIFEGSPAICSDPAESTPHGTRVIGGVKASLGVYCDPPKQCSLAQGVRNGYILRWKRGGTRIQMDSAHLTLAQLLTVARGLSRSVSRSRARGPADRPRRACASARSARGRPPGGRPRSPGDARRPRPPSNGTRPRQACPEEP